MSDSDSPIAGSYVGWKGWVGNLPFGDLGAGEAAYFRAELKSAMRGAPPISRVLEIGYGNGSFLAYCQRQGWSVTGTELEPELVAAGTAAGFDVHIADEITALAEGAFDLVVLFDVLEHIPQDAIITLLAELSKALKPAGRILLRFPNADSWLGNALQNGDPTHVTAVGYLKMTYFARGASLSVLSFRGARRRGFSESFVHGIYSITVGPVLRFFALIERLLYFPGLPVVLSSSNVVCVLGKPPTATYSAITDRDNPAPKR